MAKAALNAQQKKAVESSSKNILVLAGAGTGKTTTLVSRISSLIEKGVEPKNILALTFTNKAAQEIKTRVNEATSNEAYDLRVATFHGLCNLMIRMNADEIGIDPSYQIIDASEQKQVMKSIVSEKRNELSVDSYKDIPDKEIVKVSYSKISFMKERGITYREAKNPADVDWDLVRLFELYEENKRNSSLLDFADLLIIAVKMLQNPEIQEKYHNLWRYMLVDEFQDTNEIQMKFINLINPENLFVVGDDDQSIYGFRGADVGNILGFPNTHDNVEAIYLEQNYRSTPQIVSVANSLIAYNQDRFDKALFTDLESGKDVYLDEYISDRQEATQITYKIRDLLQKGISPNQIAIIYRANYISRAFEKPLMKLGITYRITGGVGFWQRQEVKNVISYLQFSENPSNSVSFERAVKFPSRGIGAKTVSKILTHADINKFDIIESIQDLIESKNIKGKQKDKLEEFINIAIEISEKNIYQSILYIMNEINIDEIYAKKDDADRKQNVNELLSAATEFSQESESKQDFLANAALLGSVDAETSQDAISLTTAHSSKGLEFDYVFIVALEDGLFPSDRAIMEDGIEEERRLGYVSITRARKELRMSYAKKRTFGGSYGKVTDESRFLVEIEPNLYKIKKYEYY